MPKNRFTLYLLSDGSGNLLEHFFSAVLTQFPKQKFDIHTLPFLGNEAAVRKAIKKISEGIVFHGLVSTKLKEVAAEECQKRRIPCWDVTGPSVQFLEKATGLRGALTPKPLHAVNLDYLHRVSALEFALQHDDSRRLEDLDKTDIVLVGISRVSKSPNALFLAYRGFQVSNVSLVPGQGLPPELQKYKKKNVVALTIQPKKLSEIRKRRFDEWQFPEINYGDLPATLREVMEAEKIYKSKGWPVIDTTDLAVEETSALILSKLGLKPKVFE